jgi:hypothetical protein
MNPDFFIEDMQETSERWLPAMEEAGMPVPDKHKVLGCGNYGCAFGSTDPKIMVKFTTSNAEANFMNYQKEARFGGIVSVHFVLSLGRTGYLIWRDRLDTCCDVAVRSLLIEHDLSHARFDSLIAEEKFHSAWDFSVYGVALQKNYASRLEKGTREEIQDGCAKMAEIPGLQDLANGLMDMAEYDLFLSDIHIKNVGKFENYNQLIVFDGQPEGDTDILMQYPIPEV